MNQIGEYEAIQTLLIKIYSTSFKISFQGFNISFKDIIFDAMLEMLSRKPITSASFDSVMENSPKVPSKWGHISSKCRLIQVFKTLKLSSMGLKFGEYGGRYRTSHPCEVMSSSIRALQCMLALSMMITLFGAGKGLHRGSNSSASHRKKASPLNQPSRIPVQGR